MAKSVRQHSIVKAGKLKKSKTSLICVVIAEGSTTALPVSTSITAHFCFPVSLHNKNVLLRWAVGGSFEPVLHHWAYISIVRRQGPDGQKGSTRKSTATCSTLGGIGSVGLHFARVSPCDDNKQPYHTGSVAARVNKDRAFRRTPGRKCQVCYWCIIEDSRKRQHHHRHLEHKDTKNCRETSGTNTRNGQVPMEHARTL